MIASGADHDKVARSNPGWTEFEWCRYWEIDARKSFKRAGLQDPGRRMDCGDEHCLCRRLK